MYLHILVWCVYQPFRGGIAVEVGVADGTEPLGVLLVLQFTLKGAVSVLPCIDHLEPDTSVTDGV